MSVHSSNPRRILVVDDNQDAAMSLAVLLREIGYQVETAFDGRTAIEAARRFGPEICILDINMPGMTGYELARRIRELAPQNPPVLATMTAYHDGHHLDRAVDAGFDLHFTKPADVSDMVEQLEDCLAQERSEF